MFLIVLILAFLIPNGSQGFDTPRICAYTISNETQISGGEDTNDATMISNGQQSNNAIGLVECKNGIFSCYTLWKNVKNSNNTVSTIVMAQGCWEASDGSCQSEDCEPQARPPKARRDTIFCCCSGDFCNLNVTASQPVELMPPPSTPLSGLVYQTNISTVRLERVIAVIVLVVIILVFLSMLIFRKWTPKGKPLNPPHTCLSPRPKTMKETLTLKSINFIKVVGQGRYGTVWLGSIQDQDIAVKMFPEHYVQYYYNERDIYTLPFMEHPSLLRYFGCDEMSSKASAQAKYSIILSYCPLGNLQDYLRANVIDFSTFCMMSRSIASGLAYLHTEIRKGDLWKPCITHRDINSQNILVKRDLSCCISDLGLAVKITGSRYYTLGQEQNAETRSINDVGTLRYMAPEVLEGAVNLRDCESSLKQIDVYALGLVMWEMTMRTADFYVKPSDIPPYMMPFEREVGLHPSFEQMQVLICRNKAKPLYPPEWRNTGQIKLLKETIDDCTDQDGEARLTALCVKERLSQFFRGSVYVCGSSPSTAQMSFHAPVTLYNNAIEHAEMGESVEGISEGTVETLITLSPSEPPQNGYCITNLQPYQGWNPCMERNLLSNRGLCNEEVVIVQTSSKHLSSESDSLIRCSEKRTPTIPYLQNRPFTKPLPLKQTNQAISDLLGKPLKKLLKKAEQEEEMETLTEPRLIVSPFEEPKRKERPVSLELSHPSDDETSRLKELSGRIKTPGDLPPSVRKKRGTRLSLYDDRIMTGSNGFDSTF